MRTPLSFLWECLEALCTKFVERVRHYAGNRDFQWNSEDEEDFWIIVLSDELFD